MKTNNNIVSKMKNAGRKIVSGLALIAAISTFSSCEKDEGKLPSITFKTGSGYTSSDATVGKNSSVVIGIEASKSEKKDVLKTFDASKSYDGGAETSFASSSLSGIEEDNYSYETTITTRNVAGTEKYTFTVVNRDGLVNSVSLTLVVN